MRICIWNIYEKRLRPLLIILSLAISAFFRDDLLILHGNWILFAEYFVPFSRRLRERTKQRAPTCLHDWPSRAGRWQSQRAAPQQLEHVPLRSACTVLARANHKILQHYERKRQTDWTGAQGCTRTEVPYRRNQQLQGLPHDAGHSGIPSYRSKALAKITHFPSCHPSPTYTLLRLTAGRRAAGHRDRRQTAFLADW